jgi:exopolyphosphatase/guanosine-5'-triphosphate,3'-diphosphate pyrophosphatase
MRQHEHPVSVIHEYAIATDDALELADLIGMMSERSVGLLSSVSRRRRPIMPYAALTLARIAEVTKPERVVASAHGLREGYVRDVLGLTDGDPLLDYSRYAGAATARIPPDGEKVLAWLSPLFGGLDRETARWVEAACWLSDLAGREHPDRRADIALARGSNLPSVAFPHAARAFIGTALKVRYSGPKKRSVGDSVLSDTLLTEEQTCLAFRLGTALRLGHAISPSGRALDRTPLVVSPETIALDGPLGLLSGDTVGRRFASLAAEFKRAPVLLGARAAA